MSDVIKVNKKPIRISSNSASSLIIKPFEDNQQDSTRIALENEYKRGLDDGQKIIEEKLQNQFNEKLIRKYDELNNLIANLNDAAIKLENDFEELVITVGYHLAEILVKREISKESIIKEVLAESLKKVFGANEIIVKLNPKDYEIFLAEGRPFQLEDSFSKIKFEKDGRIELGGCLVESEIGNADGRINSQFNELKRKLYSELN